MKALTDTYDAAITKAEQYGLAEQALTGARDQQIAKLTAARDGQAQSITDTLHARLLADQGDPLGAGLISFDLQAKQQEQQLWDQIAALGLSGTQYAADRIVEIEQALAAERLKIEQDYASRSKRTAQGLLTQLAFGSGSPRRHRAPCGRLGTVRDFRRADPGRPGRRCARRGCRGPSRHGNRTGPADPQHPDQSHHSHQCPGDPHARDDAGHPSH